MPNLLNKPFLPQGYTPAQTAKSWVALVGPTLMLILAALNTYQPFLSGQAAVVVGALITMLNGVLVFYTPNAPTTATPPRKTPWPTS